MMRSYLLQRRVTVCEDGMETQTKMGRSRLNNLNSQASEFSTQIQQTVSPTPLTYIPLSEITNGS